MQIRMYLNGQFFRTHQPGTKFQKGIDVSVLDERGDDTGESVTFKPRVKWSNKYFYEDPSLEKSGICVKMALNPVEPEPKPEIKVSTTTAKLATMKAAKNILKKKAKKKKKKE